MSQSLADVIDLDRCPVQNENYRAECKRTLDEHGVLVLSDFLTSSALMSIQAEGDENQHLAYYTVQKHNIYLEPSDPLYSAEHPRNRQVSSSKACITTDQIPMSSINLHYAHEEQELGWHYDNSSFAITLMVQAPEDGGVSLSESARMTFFGRLR